MDKVNILMATFNGGLYLSEQINSIEAQTYKNWELYIRDDGSTDDTTKIVKSYVKRDHRIQLLPSLGQNIGARHNFALLMENVVGSYVMFCDQDDIWLPDKIEITLKAMKESEHWFGESIPTLVHTDCKVVDSACRVICSSFMQYQHMKHVEDNPLRILLTQNFVTGCTMMINRSLLSKSLPVPHTAVMHDWWIALVAAAIGRIVFLPNATLLYRQHAENAVGAKKIISKRNLRRLLKLKELDAAMVKLMLQNCALLKHLDSLYGVRTPEILEKFIGAASNRGVSALIYVVKNKIVKQGALRNLLFYFQLVRGSYIPAIQSECIKWQRQ